MSNWCATGSRPSGKYGGVRSRRRPTEPSDEPKGLTWADLHWDNLGKTSKRLTGRGPNHNLARKLYREGYDLFQQAMKAEPHRKADTRAKIRPAVVSRLQRFTFRPLTTDEIEGKLTRILEAEGRVAEPDALDLIARLAAGWHARRGIAARPGARDLRCGHRCRSCARPAGPRSGSGHRPIRRCARERRCAVGHRGPRPAGGEGRDLVAFSEQVVTRLRERLVASMSDRDAAPQTAALASAARRLTGIDASRSGLGGYRWQLELALLASVPSGPAATRPIAATPSPAPVAPTAPEPTPAPPRRSSAGSPHPCAGSAPRPTSRAGIRPHPRPRVHRGARDVARARIRRPARGDHRTLDRAIVTWIGRNPLNKPLVANCRPVEVRDGVLILGFPENQPFLREKAEQRRNGARGRARTRPWAGRSGYAACGQRRAGGSPATADDLDLVAQARKVFGGDLADVATSADVGRPGRPRT